MQWDRLLYKLWKYYMGAGLIITYCLKNFIFDDDCIACQKHGKHGDKKILIDSVLCVLVLMGFELPFTGADVATTTFIFCSCQNWHVWVQCLFFNKPIVPHWVYIINIQYIPLYLYFLYAFFCPKNFYWLMLWLAF